MPARPYVVPDALFPSCNGLGIPTLDLTMEADTLDLPLRPWGFQRQDMLFSGTFHFYIADYKFEGVLAKPSQLLQSRCPSAVEPNCSLGDQMPRYEAIGRIGRKRWVARYWQQQGVRVWADCYVQPRWRNLNLLGVPSAWSHFAVRGADSRLWEIRTLAEFLRERCRPTPLSLLVYAGGAQTQRMCQREGWLFVEGEIEQRSKIRRRGFIEPKQQPDVEVWERPLAGLPVEHA